MTVAAGTGRTAIYDADGSNRNWPFSFRVLDTSHVYLEVIDGNGTVSNVTSGFTVTGLGDSEGGAVVYPVAPAPALPAPYKARVVRNVPFEQPAQIGRQGGFHASTHEDALDLLAMQVQQVYQRGTARGIVANPDEPALNPLPSLSLRANRILVFDANGQIVPGPAVGEAMAVVPYPTSEQVGHYLRATWAGQFSWGQIEMAHVVGLSTALANLTAPGDPETASAWVTFNGTNGAIIRSYGIHSVVRNVTGGYSVNFTAPFLTSGYCVVGSASGARMDPVGFNVGTCVVETRDATGAYVDPARVNVAFFF